MSKKKTQKNLQTGSQPTAKYPAENQREATLSASDTTPSPESKPTSINNLSFLQGRETLIGAVILLLLGCVVFKDYVLGRYLYFFKDIGSDSYNTIYPNIVFYGNYLRNIGTPGWSFQQGMGQNVYPFWFDQFYFVLNFLGADSALRSVGTLQMLEAVLSGFVFLLFLREHKLPSNSIILGALAYGFCGFIVACGGWDNRFAVETFNAALLLLALERFIARGSWWLLPVSIALIAANQPFDLYIFGILILIYTTYRFIDLYGIDFQKLLILLVRIGFVSALGMGLSGIMLLENIQQLLDSPRVAGGVSYASKLASENTMAAGPFYQTILARFYSNDLLGTGFDFKGWNNYFEAPFLYCGLLCLVAVPQVFSFADTRRKVLYATLLVLCAAVLAMPSLRYLFWLYTGDYFRTLTLFISMVLILLTAKAIAHIQEESHLSWVALGGSLAFWLGILYFYLDIEGLDKSQRFLISVFLIINALGLFLLSTKNLKIVGQVALIVIVFVEIVMLPSKSVKATARQAMPKDELEERTGFKDYTLDAVDYLKKQDPTFYRIDKDYASGTSVHTSFSDPKIQDYFGTKSYHSFNQINYIRFLQGMGFIQKGDEISTRWANGVSANLLVQSVCGVKYFMSKQANRQPYGTVMGWDSVAKFNDVVLLKNRYVLPLGVTYDTALEDSAFDDLSSNAKAIVLLKSAVLSKEQITRFKELKNFNADTTSSAFTVAEYEASTNARKAESLNISKFDNNYIEGQITTSSPKLLFLSIPLDRGWHATLNGKEVPLERVNIGFSGLMLPAGKHQLVLQYELPWKQKGLILSLVSLIGLAGAIFWTSKKKKTLEV
jgi:uncharacterized membrane protein YfhO